MVYPWDNLPIIVKLVFPWDNLSMIIIIMIAEQTQIPFQGFDTGYIWFIHGLYMGYQ